MTPGTLLFIFTTISLETGYDGVERQKKRICSCMLTNNANQPVLLMIDKKQQNKMRHPKPS